MEEKVKSTSKIAHKTQKRYTEEEKEKMYTLWKETQSLNKVISTFNTTFSTVKNMSVKYEWEKRYTKEKMEIERVKSKELSKEIISEMDLTKTLLFRIGRNLLNDESRKFSVAEFKMIAELYLTLGGIDLAMIGSKGAPNLNVVINNANQAAPTSPANINESDKVTSEQRLAIYKILNQKKPDIVVDADKDSDD